MDCGSIVMDGQPNHSIIVDLNHFKLYIRAAPDIEFTLHFNTPSRRFYLSVIALVIHEMKEKGKVISIPLADHYKVLAMLNKTVGNSAGSSEKEQLLYRVYRKWKDALPDLQNAPLFKIVGRKRERNSLTDNMYGFSEKEKDNWANLFEYKGSHGQVRLRFSLDRLGIGLDDAAIIYGVSREEGRFDDWNEFIVKTEGGDGLDSNLEPDAAHKLNYQQSPWTTRVGVFVSSNKSLVVVMVGIILFCAAGLTWKSYLKKDEKVPFFVEEVFKLPQKPSIAVLPFLNLSNNPENDLICDALTGDIISALSHEHELFVIDRHSSFFYKGKSVTVKKVAEELGVQYVLEGSALKSGERIRINAQVIDSLSGEHIWSERYERSFTDLFDLEDEITLNIMSNLQSELLKSRGTVLKKRETNSLEAWLLYEKGRRFGSSHAKENTYRAKEYYEQALAIDPDFVRPLVGLGWKYWHIGEKGYSENPAEALRKAEEIALHAVEKYPDNAEPIGLLVGIKMTKREFSEALKLAKQAIEINPNYGESYAILGWVLLANMLPEKSIEQFEIAMRLDPYYPAWYLNVMIRSYVFARRYEEARSAISQQLVRSPGEFFVGQAHLNLAFVFYENNQLEEAQVEMQNALACFPQMTINLIRREIDCVDNSFVAHYINVLEKLGVPH